MALHLLYSAFLGMYRGVMVGNVRRGAIASAERHPALALRYGTRAVGRWLRHSVGASLLIRLRKGRPQFDHNYGDAVANECTATEIPLLRGHCRTVGPLSCRLVQ